MKKSAWENKDFIKSEPTFMDQQTETQISFSFLYSKLVYSSLLKLAVCLFLFVWYEVAFSIFSSTLEFTDH